jgi:hypothetical protein
MASIRNEFWIDAAPDFVWDAVRDIGALHTRLVPGFVVDTKLEGDPPTARVVTFGNGNVARELIVDLDDAQRRLAWAIVGGPRLVFYSASFQVFAEGTNKTRCVWSADLLPNEMAAPVKAMILDSCATMKKTMDGAGE